MALIVCSECGKEISDKVKSCPHCGYPLVENAEQESPQKVEVTAVSLGPKSTAQKKKVIIFAAVAVILIIAVIAIIFAVKKNSEESARAAYIDNLSLARITMLSGAADAEALCNLAKSVWYNTIYEKSDIETDKYTKTSNRKFNDDFNVSLRALYRDSSTLETISKIEENQEMVSTIMRDLQNPPEDFNACYSTIDSMYESYKSFTDLAISPSGSLTSFSEEFRTYDNDFMKYYDKLDSQIPEQ